MIILAHLNQTKNDNKKWDVLFKTEHLVNRSGGIPNEEVILKSVWPEGLNIQWNKKRIPILFAI